MSERDTAEDYVRAYKAEYASYKTAGRDDRAADVAAVLRQLGHQVDVPVKATAVADDSTVERAVEAATPPRRTGRPPKASPA